MTDEPSSPRRRRLAEEAGFGQVEFREGQIEDLPVEDGTVDCVISNGVINLSPDKPACFAAAASAAARAGGWRSRTSSRRDTCPRASPATPHCGPPASAEPPNETTTTASDAGVRVVRRDNLYGSSPTGRSAPPRRTA